jgi:hypothetical protein
MTDVASTPMGMRVKTIARLLAVSAVILSASPAFATQIARHDTHCHICNQNTEPCEYRTFGTCSPHEINAPHLNSGQTLHDDWPNNMILG